MKNIDKTFYDLDATVLPTGIKNYRKEHGKGTIVHDARIGVKITGVEKLIFSPIIKVNL